MTPALPIVEVLLSVFIPFDVNDQIRRGNGEGRVLGGQPRHSILHKCVVRFVGDN